MNYFSNSSIKDQNPYTSNYKLGVLRVIKILKKERKTRKEIINKISFAHQNSCSQSSRWTSLCKSVKIRRK